MRNEKLAVAYIRVSTNKQELGPKAQRKKILDWCGENGVEIMHWFEETVSGFAPLTKRPQLLAAIEAAAEFRCAWIVAASRDRIGRRAFTIQYLERLLDWKSLAFISASGDLVDRDDPEAIMVWQILDAVAEFERKMISARTSAALDVRRRMGQATNGQPPFGWDKVKSRKKDVPAVLEPNVGEQIVIKKIVRLRGDGHSIKRIAQMLEDDEHPAKCGLDWHPTAVQRVLDREAENG